MTSRSASVEVWVLDSSTFIHFCIIERVRILVRCRSPLRVPAYVYRTELTGPSAKTSTRDDAERAVATGHLVVRHLSVEDLSRMAALGPRRSAALGEIACALLADRERGGVLIDDWRARRWLQRRIVLRAWESIEDVLVDAAHRCELTELDLDACQARLRDHNYDCRCHLRNEYLMQRLARHHQDGA